MVKKRTCTIFLYMEGGGNTRELHTSLRQGMISLLEKIGLKGVMPRVFPCGSRNDAYSDFKQAVKEGRDAVLLVDSESAVCDAHEKLPWAHLKQQDGWEKPDRTTDDQCHLMVQCMESWFLADVEAVATYYNQGFNRKHFPVQGQNVETIDKADVYSRIENAIRACSKNTYSKGRHSFEILGRIDPEKIKAASKWAERFFETLSKNCQ